MVALSMGIGRNADVGLGVPCPAEGFVVTLELLEITGVIEIDIVLDVERRMEKLKSRRELWVHNMTRDWVLGGR